MVSPITNDCRPSPLRKPLPVERAFLYRPESEWTYSHHPHLTAFRGRYVAMWSNGREYGYPHTLLHGGCLHVIVSRQKEAVEVLRVELRAVP